MPRGTRTAPSARRPLPTPEPPELPAWKAFVVQFSRDAGSPSGSFGGRVEHLSSGRRARFASPKELIRSLELLLQELTEPPTS